MTCRVKDCPIPDEPHIPACLRLAGHRCWGRPTHQHKPKKGMGGNNPDSKIVAILCSAIHDAIDNSLRLKGVGYYDVVKDGRYEISGISRERDRAGIFKRYSISVPVLGAA